MCRKIMPVPVLTPCLYAKPQWQQLCHPLLSSRAIELWLCQMKTALPAVSGNKWLKLKYHIQQLQQQQKQGIVTFGGAFSNHLSAVAAACQHYQLKSLAYLRADTFDYSNPTLSRCQAQGMQFILLNRHDYRQRDDADFILQLQHKHPDLLLVPEGGSSVLGAQGMDELNLRNTPAGIADVVISAAASGGTLAGLIQTQGTPVLGIAVVNDDSLAQRVQRLLPLGQQLPPWNICMAHTQSGYARFNSECLTLCRQLAQQGIFVEPIYTGKALLGIFKMVADGVFNTGSRLSFFHTGGLQGLDGLLYRGLISTADYALLSEPVAD